MTIIVLTEKKEARVVELSNPLELRQGTHLNCIVGGDGIGHFFTKQGYYDSWGMAYPRAGKDAR